MWPRAELAALLCVVCAGLAVAQGGALGADRSIPPTPSPVGSGARAAGMANAFVAIADDATAAAWNPAGLVQLERPELSIVGESMWNTDDFNSDIHPESDGTHDFSDLSLNFFSGVYPIRHPILGRNVVLSLSYQRRYDFTRNFNTRLHTTNTLPGGGLIGQRSTLDFEQSGGLGALSPSVAFEVTKRLSVGLSVNFFRDTPFGEAGWEQTTRVNTEFSNGKSFALSRGYSHESYEDVRGESVTLGALWRASSRWTVGLRYDSALRARAHYASIDRSLQSVPNPFMPIVSNLAQSEEERRLRFPSTFSLGAAYRRNDRLTLSFDISRTDWDNAYVKSAKGTRYSLVDGANLDDARTRTHLDPAFAVRLGAEYVFIPKKHKETLDYLWSVRGGVFLEQEPASGRDVRHFFRPGDGKPDNFYGFALGAGLLLKQRVNFDLAYQLRFGQDVNGDLNPGVSELHGDEISHRVVFSTVIYF